MYTCRLHSNARYVTPLAQQSVRLLPSGTIEPLDLQLGHIIKWASATPSLYYTHGLIMDAAAVPALLVSLLQHQLFASVAYSTVMEQLAERSAPSGDSLHDLKDAYAHDNQSWSPLIQVGSKNCSNCCS